MLKRNKNQKGFAAFYLTVLILAVVFTIGASVSILIYGQEKISRNIIKSSQAYYTAEAGIEDSIYRIIKEKKYEAANSLQVGTQGAATISIISQNNKKIVKSIGEISQTIRILETILSTDLDSISFHYGAQIDKGGLWLGSNASVQGNVYSNGNIEGQSKKSSEITGEAWVAGEITSTHLDKIKVGKDAYANTITNSVIGEDAYYQVIDDETTVEGIKYPDSPDPSNKDLPISYGQIQDWEKGACCDTGSGCKEECIHIGDLDLVEGDSIGPMKIEGNLTFPKDSKDNPIIIEGPIWVTGKISAKNNVTIKLKDGLEYGYPIIADNPFDQINDGKIKFDNNVITQDSDEGGKLLFISTNKSLDSANPAIYLYNNVNKDTAQSIIFSLQGLIKVENNAKFKEITGYALYLDNNAEIVYEQGLINSNFSSGPGGGWKVISWTETQ